MYPSDNSISIIKVNNGYVVTKPFEHMPMPVYPGPMGGYTSGRTNPLGPEFINAMVKVQKRVRKELEDDQDPVLSKISEEQAEEEVKEVEEIEEATSANARRIIRREENVFIFKTFPEVIQFLQDYYKE